MAEEKNIQDMFMYKSLLTNVRALIAAGQDPIEAIVALNAIAIQLTSELDVR